MQLVLQVMAFAGGRNCSCSYPGEVNESPVLDRTLWADARNEGHPFAHEHALDGDVILLAQSKLLQEGNENDHVIIATTNVKHLSRYADASEWQKI